MQLRSKATRIPIENILVVTDGAPCDNVAVLYGIDLAHEYVARLQVIHVVSAGLQKKILEVDSLYGRWREEKSFIRRRSVERERFPFVLLQALGLHHFDLVIVASSAESARKGLGEIVERTLFSVDCPVLVLGPGIPDDEVPRANPRTILYATDFSRRSSNAARHAFCWAQQHQAWLTMLHVVEGVRRSALGTPASFAEPFRGWMEDLVTDDVEQWAEVDHRVEFGGVSEVIVSTAQKLYADLIVLGANSLHHAGENVVSAKTKQVLLRADCPVLLVRQQMASRYSLTGEQKHELVAA
jgi:nucleotide-binding universal stress UspA family protein